MDLLGKCMKAIDMFTSVEGYKPLTLLVPFHLYDTLVDCTPPSVRPQGGGIYASLNGVKLKFPNEKLDVIRLVGKHPSHYYFYNLSGLDSPITQQPTICECGASKVGSSLHSSWCPLI